MGKQLIVLIWILFLSSGGQAQVYRWVDESGKVHFSDKKPKSGVAEDISATVKQNNIDASGAESRKLQKVFAEETVAEKQLREREESRREARRQQLRKICAQARERLHILKGRIYMTDAQGRPYDISEKERQQRERELEAQIREHCI